MLLLCSGVREGSGVEEGSGVPVVLAQGCALAEGQGVGDPLAVAGAGLAEGLPVAAGEREDASEKLGEALADPVDGGEREAPGEALLLGVAQGRVEAVGAAPVALPEGVWAPGVAVVGAEAVADSEGGAEGVRAALGVGCAVGNAEAVKNAEGEPPPPPVALCAELALGVAEPEAAGADAVNGGLGVGGAVTVGAKGVALAVGKYPVALGAAEAEEAGEVEAVAAPGGEKVARPEGVRMGEREPPAAGDGVAPLVAALLGEG